MLTPTLSTLRGYYFWKHVAFWNNFSNILVKTKFLFNTKHTACMCYFSPCLYTPIIIRGNETKTLLFMCKFLYFPSIFQGSNLVHHIVLNLAPFVWTPMSKTQYWNWQYLHREIFVGGVYFWRVKLILSSYTVYIHLKGIFWMISVQRYQ